MTEKEVERTLGAHPSSRNSSLKRRRRRKFPHRYVNARFDPPPRGETKKNLFFLRRRLHLARYARDGNLKKTIN